MGAIRRSLAGLGLSVFLAAVFLRPLLSSPAVQGLSGALSPTELALLGPTLLVAALLVLIRARRLFDDDPDRTTDRRTQQRREGYWESREERDSDDRGQTAITQALGGQGGARDRGFEVEEVPPEADLDLHLEHLRAELDEDSVELETLAEVAEQADGSSVPRRCPQPHCDAAWTEPGILDIKNGRYEELGDGRVQCLECESVVELD